MTCIDNVNISEGRIHFTRKNTEALVSASKMILLKKMLTNLSAWTCLEIRMEDEDTVVPLKGCNRSNIREKSRRIKILFRKILRAD